MPSNRRNRPKIEVNNEYLNAQHEKYCRNNPAFEKLEKFTEELYPWSSNKNDDEGNGNRNSNNSFSSSSMFQRKR